MTKCMPGSDNVPEVILLRFVFGTTKLSKSLAITLQVQATTSPIALSDNKGPIIHADDMPRVL